MSESAWYFRCVGVPPATVEAVVKSLTTGAVMHVDDGDGVDPIVEVQIEVGSCDEARAAVELRGLVWFRRWNTSEDSDSGALYLDGSLVFRMMDCALLSSDSIEVGPGVLELLPNSVSDLIDPRAWIIRLVEERFGPDFARVTGSDTWLRPPHAPAPATSDAQTMDVASAGDDDIPF